MLETIGNWASLMLMLVGLVLVVWSMRYRSEKRFPFMSFNPKDWKPIWRQKSLFKPKGFKFYIVGWELFLLGVVITLVDGFLT